MGSQPTGATERGKRRISTLGCLNELPEPKNTTQIQTRAPEGGRGISLPRCFGVHRVHGFGRVDGVFRVDEEFRGVGRLYGVCGVCKVLGFLGLVGDDGGWGKGFTALRGFTSGSWVDVRLDVTTALSAFKISQETLTGPCFCTTFARTALESHTKPQCWHTFKSQLEDSVRQSSNLPLPKSPRPLF